MNIKGRIPSLLSVLTGVVALSLSEWTASAQFDITSFNPTTAGPWSEPGKTTIVVPKVANGSVILDGAISDSEYGGFSAVSVTPGENAWILDAPDDRMWDGPEDSSF